MRWFVRESHAVVAVFCIYPTANALTRGFDFDKLSDRGEHARATLVGRLQERLVATRHERVWVTLAHREDDTWITSVIEIKPPESLLDVPETYTLLGKFFAHELLQIRYATRADMTWSHSFSLLTTACIIRLTCGVHWNSCSSEGFDSRHDFYLSEQASPT